MDKNLIQRLISGFIYGIIIVMGTTPLGESFFSIIGLSVPQHLIFLVLLSLILLLGVWECLQILKLKQGWQRLLTLPLALGVFYYFASLYLAGGFDHQFNLTHILALFLFFSACITLFYFKSELENDLGKMLFTVLYVGLPLGFSLGLITLDSAEKFSWEVFWLFVLIWSSDSFAYFSGRLFGKHLMAPKISPKKTWEGLIGGVVLTLLFSFFIESNLPQLQGNWIVVGFLVAISAPLGDLIESQLKRNFNVKDSGKIIPGHGGILDRLDSFLFCAPVLYLYFIIHNFI